GARGVAREIFDCAAVRDGERSLACAANNQQPRRADLLEARAGAADRQVARRSRVEADAGQVRGANQSAREDFEAADPMIADGEGTVGREMLEQGPGVRNRRRTERLRGAEVLAANR